MHEQKELNRHRRRRSVVGLEDHVGLVQTRIERRDGTDGLAGTRATKAVYSDV